MLCRLVWLCVESMLSFLFFFMKSTLLISFFSPLCRFSSLRSLIQYLASYICLRSWCYQISMLFLFFLRICQERVYFPEKKVTVTVASIKKEPGTHFARDLGSWFNVGHFVCENLDLGTLQLWTYMWKKSLLSHNSIYLFKRF